MAFQESDARAEVHDIVDYGQNGLTDGATNSNPSILPETSGISLSIMHAHIQSSKWNAEDEGIEVTDNVTIAALYLS